MRFYNIHTLYIRHFISCFTTVSKKGIPSSCTSLLVELLLFNLSALYEAAVSAVVGDFAAPHLLHHLGPELGAGHTPQLALGQHVEDCLRGILFRLGGADAALLHEVGVLLVGAAVKDGHGCLHALHLRLLDVEQGCPGRGGVAAFLVAEVELFAVLVAAHHEDAAGDVPDVGAVGQTGAARDVGALVGVHRDEGRAAVPGAEGLEGQQGAAHLVAAGHLHPRRQKALQRVDDDEGGRGLPHVLCKAGVRDAERAAGAGKVGVAGDHHHPAHIGPCRRQAGFEHLAGVVLAGKDEDAAGLLRRLGEEAGGLSRRDIGNELGLPDALAGAAVGTQKRHLPHRQQPIHQPAHVLDGDVLEAVGGEAEGRGAAAVPEARPGRVGLFPVGGVVLGDAALELLPAHRFQLALAVGQPALHPEGQALPEAQLLRPRLHQLGAAEDVLGAVLPGEPVGQPGEQLLFGAHRAEVGHEVVVAARGAVGHVFLHKSSFRRLFCCFHYNHERLCSQRKLSAYFCAEK